MNVAPGASYETVASGFDTGLVGTIGVRVIDNAGATTTARVTAGVIEYPAGSGIYQKTLTAPSTAGQYTIVWDNGAATPGNDAIDDLVVTYSSAATTAPSGRDLCTVADVVALVPGYTLGSDADTDAILATLVTEQSRDAMERTGREFVAITGLNLRSFDIDTRAARLRRILVGDLTSLNSVTIKDAQGNTVQTVDPAGVVLEPRIREDWQPVADLRFRTDAATPASLLVGYVAVIDAVWGFPLVPTTVAQAVARLVIVRYLNDVAANGTDFSEAANRADFNIAYALRWSLDTLDRFYVPLFQSSGDWQTSGSRGVAGVDW